MPSSFSRPLCSAASNVRHNPPMHQNNTEGQRQGKPAPAFITSVHQWGCRPRWQWSSGLPALCSNVAGPLCCFFLPCQSTTLPTNMVISSSPLPWACANPPGPACQVLRQAAEYSLALGRGHKTLCKLSKCLAGRTRPASTCSTKQFASHITLCKVQHATCTPAGMQSAGLEAQAHLTGIPLSPDCSPAPSSQLCRWSRTLFTQAATPPWQPSW